MDNYNSILLIRKLDEKCGIFVNKFTVLFWSSLELVVQYLVSCEVRVLSKHAMCPSMVTMV